MQKYFLSCDWGTTSFRLKLMDVHNGPVSETLTSERGVATIFQEWKEQGEKENKSREHFFLQQLQHAIKSLGQLSPSLRNCPVVISGMASSSIGIKELPYAPLPFSINGNDALLYSLPIMEGFAHEVWLISGACNEGDVMRGEETQMIGLAEMDGSVFSEQLSICIFPGTHSKHILVEKKEITDIKTYMTGEVFQLMLQHSILKDGISLSGLKPSLNHTNIQAFRKGISESKCSNLLHNLFSVRINHLFRKLTGEENYYYLSGLLIGTELRDIIDTGRIVLCCGSKISDLYQLAIEQLDLLGRTLCIDSHTVDRTAAEGHLKLFKNKIVTSN